MTRHFGYHLPLIPYRTFLIGEEPKLALKLKIILSTALWTVAIATAIAYIVFGSGALIVSTVITAAAAAVVSAMIAGDYIAAAATRHLLHELAAERDATVDAAVEAIEGAVQQHADKVVSRTKSANEAMLRRVVADLAEALEADQPVPLRR